VPHLEIASTPIAITDRVGVEIHHSTNDLLLPPESPTMDFIRRATDTLGLTVHRGGLPRIADDDLRFDSEGCWAVHRENGADVFVLMSGTTRDPYEVAVIEFQSMRGELHLNDCCSCSAYPFEYPLSEIVFSKLLVDRRFLIVHACGADIGGRGFLFAGESGAGKSTIATLLSCDDTVRILSDDRTAAGRQNGRARIYGTPWHGTSGLCAPRSAALNCIFFLHHDSRNRFKRLNQGPAAARLLSLSVVPYWDRISSEKALTTAIHLARHVPAYELGFVPDRDILEFILEFDDLSMPAQL
jgi:hypothetical protein